MCIYIYIHPYIYIHLYSYIYIYIYLVIHRRIYQNSSVWLDARSRDRNPSNFTSDCVSDHSSTKWTSLAKGILRYFYFLKQQQQPLFTFFIPYRLPECSILSKSFALRERRPAIPSPESSTPMGEHILSSTDRLFHSIKTLHIYIYLDV